MHNGEEKFSTEECKNELDFNLAIPDEPRKISFYIKVGGIAGIGCSKVYATFTIEKSRFAPGE